MNLLPIEQIAPLKEAEVDNDLITELSVNGQSRPVVINQHNVIIEGAEIHAAAKALGWTEVAGVRIVEQERPGITLTDEQSEEAFELMNQINPDNPVEGMLETLRNAAKAAQE